jgi:hypothetical protein
MKRKVTIEFDDAEEAKEAPQKETQAQAGDAWHFGEIRETLWGKGSSSDPLGLGKLRKTLWGK